MYCSRRLGRPFKAADIAIACLLNACEQLDLGEEFFLGIVPRVMMTAAARECLEELKSTVSTVQVAAASMAVQNLHSTSSVL